MNTDNTTGAGINMMREEIIEFASQSPEFEQGINLLQERLSRTAMVPEDLT